MDKIIDVCRKSGAQVCPHLAPLTLADRVPTGRSSRLRFSERKRRLCRTTRASGDRVHRATCFCHREHGLQEVRSSILDAIPPHSYVSTRAASPRRSWAVRASFASMFSLWIGVSAVDRRGGSCRTRLPRLKPGPSLPRRPGVSNRFVHLFTRAYCCTA